MSRCGNCAHFYRCSQLIQAQADSTECDWIPSRFKEKVTNPSPPKATPRDQHAFHNSFRKTNPNWKGD